MSDLIKTKQDILKLIKEAEEQFAGTGKALLDIEDYVAEYLTANGVIVPPCKVGETVYVVNSLWVSEYTVEAVWWDGLMFQFNAENEEYADECSVFYFFDERIGKTVFLSREDAEKAWDGWSNDK